MHLSYLGSMKENNMFLTPLTPDDIEVLIGNVKVNKGVDPNSIQTKILKDCKSELSKPLSDMINTSFTTSIFSSALKVANIIPVHQKGDKLDCNNYWPISQLSNISKIFEKMMHIFLTFFLNKNKFLSSFQFGFWNKHSTNHALISLTEMIWLALDNDQFRCGVYKQQTVLTFKYWVWHAPRLNIRSSMYINNLSKAIIFSSVHHLVDDINILFVSSSLKDVNKKINHNLSNLVQWLKANKILLNISKTEIVVFKSHSKQITKHFNFCVSGQKIILKNYTKYLGIIIESMLHLRNIWLN